jgi:hypothetical protein
MPSQNERRAVAQLGDGDPSAGESNPVDVERGIRRRIERVGF